MMLSGHLKLVNTGVEKSMKLKIKSSFLCILVKSNCDCEFVHVLCTL